MTITVKTGHPVAFESPDHIFPWGTAQDNHTCLPLVSAVENYFGGRQIRFLDVGCSGGQFAIDFLERGHVAVGLEGSDYSVKNQRANWPKYHNRALFTCDASKPYEILTDNGQRVIFDAISSWECIEHIHPSGLDQFFRNIANHMNRGSIFFGSIAMNGDAHAYQKTDKDGNVIESGMIELHQSLFNREQWTKEIFPRYFRPVIDPNFSYLFNYRTENVRWNPECIGMKNPYGLFFTAMLK